ncbi:MAG: helix-turn-helix domain-containing protein [Thermoguttaceae bacterium]
MSQEYYNLERTAEILKITPGEVNRMREQNQLRAFRDGGNWKFRREDVENALASLVRRKQEVADVEDEDLLSLSAEDEELPTQLFQSIDLADDDMILVEEGPKETEPDLQSEVYSFAEEISSIAEEISSDLADSAHSEQDSASYADENEVTIQLVSSSNGLESSLDLGKSESGLNLGGDSGLQLGEDDEVILGAASGLSLGADSGLALGAGSGLSGLGLVDEEGREFELEPGDAVLELDEDSDILALSGASDSEGPTMLSEAHEMNLHSGDLGLSEGEDDFMSSFAEPDLEEEEATVQVAAVGPQNTVGAKKTAGPKNTVGSQNLQTKERNLGSAEMDEEPNLEVSFEDELDSASPFETEIDFGEGDGLGSFGDDLDSVSTSATPTKPKTVSVGGSQGATGSAGNMSEEVEFSPQGFGTSPSLSQPAVSSGPSPFEPRYSGMTIGLGLIPCVLFLGLAGMMMFELVRNMWSWGQDSSLLTSPIMEQIAGLFGLR